MSDLLEGILEEARKTAVAIHAQTPSGASGMHPRKREGGTANLDQAISAKGSSSVLAEPRDDVDALQLQIEEQEAVISDLQREVRAYRSRRGSQSSSRSSSRRGSVKIVQATPEYEPDRLEGDGSDRSWADPFAGGKLRAAEKDRELQVVKAKLQMLTELLDASRAEQAQDVGRLRSGPCGDSREALLEASDLAAGHCARLNARVAELEKLLQAAKSAHQVDRERLAQADKVREEAEVLRAELNASKELWNELRAKRDVAVMAENDARRTMLVAIEEKEKAQEEKEKALASLDSLLAQSSEAAQSIAKLKAESGRLSLTIEQQEKKETVVKEELMWETAKISDLERELETERSESKCLRDKVEQLMSVHRDMEMYLRQLAIPHDHLLGPQCI